MYICKSGVFHFPVRDMLLIYLKCYSCRRGGEEIGVRRQTVALATSPSCRMTCVRLNYQQDRQQSTHAIIFPDDRVTCGLSNLPAKRVSFFLSLIPFHSEIYSKLGVMRTLLVISREFSVICLVQTILQDIVCYINDI